MAATPASYSESTLTERYQTTIPEPIRQVLGLNEHDKICYTIQSDGQVVISRAEEPESDMLGQFLNFLAKDIEKNPQHLQTIDSSLLSRVQSLISEVNIDLDASLSDEDE